MVCERAIWSWVLFAFCCSWIPKCLAMLVIGEVKIVNNKEPRTAPCGTPAVQSVGSDRAVPMPTCWLRSTSLRQSHRHLSFRLVLNEVTGSGVRQKNCPENYIFFRKISENFQCIFPENFQCFVGINIILLYITILHSSKVILSFLIYFKL